jgi:hypothetical protein
MRPSRVNEAAHRIHVRPRIPGSIADFVQKIAYAGDGCRSANLSGIAQLAGNALEDN